MKQGIKFACLVAILCALAMVFAGCGNRVEGDKEGATANGAEGEHAQELEKTLVRHWHLCRTQKEGLEAWSDDDVKLSFFVKEDGEATMSLSDGGALFCRWKATSNDDITFYHEENDSKTVNGKRRSIKKYTPFAASYQPDVDELWVDGSVWGTDATLCFSGDIQFMSKNDPRPSEKDITDIASASAVVGSWELVYVGDENSAVAGKADAIAAWREYADGSMTLSEGGKGTFLGEDITWSVGDGAGIIEIADGGQKLDLKQLPDGLVVTSKTALYQFARAQ